MPMINIEDAYILGETGAQVDKVTGLFTKDEDTTSGEKAFAQLNIGTAGSNRNLLDNPWWGSGEVVNQRQITAKPSSNGAYCIDRWTWNSGADANNMSLGANGITFTRSASSIWFAQKMANPSALVGKKITGSVMLSDGTIKSGSVVYASVGSTPTLYQDSAVQIYISSVGAFSLTIKTTQTIRAVKLELGSVSTLANDAPPDYGEELLKCQRYFTRWYSTAGSSAIGLALAVGTTNANFALLSNLRAEGSATVSFTGLVLSDGTDKTVTNVSVAGAGDGKSMRLLVTSSGLTAYRPYVLQITAGGHLDVSKDL